MALGHTELDAVKDVCRLFSPRAVPFLHTQSKTPRVAPPLPPIRGGSVRISDQPRPTSL